MPGDAEATVRGAVLNAIARTSNVTGLTAGRASAALLDAIVEDIFSPAYRWATEALLAEVHAGESRLWQAVVARTISAGELVSCPREEWPKVRQALQAQGDEWRKLGDDGKADVAYSEVRRLDGIHGIPR